MIRALWLALAVLLAACEGDAAPDAWTCTLTHVVDGDTVHARCDGEKVKVRLLRIDTPEREEPGYQLAASALRGLVGDDPIRLEFEKPGLPVKDDYDRLLVYVFARERNLNVEMVRLGWSRFWTRYGTGRFAGDFRRAEAEARGARRGIWSDSSGSLAPPGSPQRFLSPACREPEGPGMHA